MIAIETCGSKASIAFIDQTGVTSLYILKEHNVQSREIINMINVLVKDYDIAYLKAIVVAVGPGSFTGIRIGIAVAYGIALPHNIKIIPVSTLEAQSMRHNNFPSLIKISANKGYCYQQLFLDKTKPEGPIELVESNDIQPELDAMLVLNAALESQAKPSNNIVPIYAGGAYE